MAGSWGGQEWFKHFRNNALGTLPMMFDAGQLSKPQVEELLSVFNKKTGASDTFKSLMDSAGGEIEVR